MMKRFASLRSLAATGDAVDDDRVEALGELEIVGRAERAAAERLEVEARDPVDRLRNVEMAPETRFEPARRAYVRSA